MNDRSRASRRSILRFPTTIWRAAIIDTWRLILLSTSVLLVVATFAVAVKPLADGDLDAPNALRFMALAVVPMIQYVLPFATGFGATLAYHRMTQDNELIAAHAGGVSHRAAFVPVGVTGLVLGGTLALLTLQVIPRFMASMEDIITEDLTRIMVNRIESGESLSFNNVMLHADRVRQMGPDETSGAFETLLLTGVGAIETDREGNVTADLTAGRAWVWFFRTEAGNLRQQGLEVYDKGGVTYVLVKLIGFAGMRDGEIYPYGEETTLQPLVWTNTFDEDPKFLTWRELDVVQSNPDQLNLIDFSRRNLAHHLAERATTQTIRQSFESERRARFLAPDGRVFVVRARMMDWRNARWEMTPVLDGGRIEVEILPVDATPDAGLTRLSAASGWMRTAIGPDPRNRSLTLTLELSDVVTRSSVVDGARVDPGEGGGRRRHRFERLTLAQNPLPDLLALDSQEMLALGRSKVDVPEPDLFLVQPTRELEHKLLVLDREIIASRHERWALPVACLLMAMTGAFSAVRLADSLPLIVYLWSFFPALFSVITISAGQQMVVPLGFPGVLLMWSGVALLGIYTAMTYLRLRKH